MADLSRRESERGTISPRRGRGLESLWDWEPFRNFFPGGGSNLYGIDVTRAEDGYDVEIPIPGFRPEDVDVTYQDGVITVTGRSERRSMTRSISVPEDIDEERIDANVEHGILTLHLKQLPERQPRRISIRGAAERGGSGSTGQSTTPSSTTQVQR